MTVLGWAVSSQHAGDTQTISCLAASLKVKFTHFYPYGLDHSRTSSAVKQPLRNWVLIKIVLLGWLCADITDGHSLRSESWLYV